MEWSNLEFASILKVFLLTGIIAATIFVIVSVFGKTGESNQLSVFAYLAKDGDSHTFVLSFGRNISELLKKIFEK